MTDPNYERKRIVVELDIDGFIALMQAEQGQTPTRIAAEISLHKLRLRPEFGAPGHLQTESYNWLYAHGCSADIRGMNPNNSDKVRR